MSTLDQTLETEKWLARRAELVAAGRLVQNDDGSVTYTLAWPFDDPVKGERIERLTLRRPKAKHLRQATSEARGDEAKAIDRLLMSITGLAPVTLGEVDGEDYVVAVQLTGDFTEGRPLTGRTPSA